MSVLSQLCDLSPTNLESFQAVESVEVADRMFTMRQTPKQDVTAYVKEKTKNKRIGEAITRGEDNHPKVGEKFSQNVNHQLEGSKNIKIRPTPKLRDRDNLRWERGGREGFTSGFAIQMICLNI